MQDQINRLSNEILNPRRDAIAKLNTKKVVEGQPNDLSDIRGMISDLVAWSKWIARLDPADYYKHFSADDLQRISDNLAGAVDTLAGIQNDRENNNTAGRIFADPGSLRNDILNFHGFLIVIGRARTAGRTILNEAREAADKAVAAKEETEKVAQLKAIGTLAEYFQELVVQGDGTGHKIEKHNWWKNQGYEYKARRWLWITAIAAIGAVIYSLLIVINLNNVEPGDSSSQIYAKLVTKIVAVFPAFYLVRIFQRNYNAFMHLAAINRHKAQALKTLKAYLEDPTITPEARVEILKEANKHIFETNETGFITNKEGAGSSEGEFKIGPLNISS